MLRTLLAATFVVSSITGALAQNTNRGGTPEEQRACSKDVSRYCRALMNDSDFAILGCLQQNRQKISKPSDAVLRSHGQ